MDHQQLSDEELLTRLRNGMLAAGALLYERHKQSVYGFCLRMTGNPDASQDIVQETFLKMLSRNGSIDHGIALRSWLFSVARNELRMVVRKRSARQEEPFDEEGTVADFPDPLERLMERERSSRIETALQYLRPLYREALVLRESEGMTYDEIAAVTGASLSAVKSRIHKAREAMYRLLLPYQKEGE